MSYTTVQGQTWDQIAKDVYGKETCADVLMRANPKHLDIFVFDAGTELVTPEIRAEQTDLPLWRRRS